MWCPEALHDSPISNQTLDLKTDNDWLEYDVEGELISKNFRACKSQAQ